MSIYTKTGDSGQTSLLKGGRVEKDCINLQAVGALDELGAVLGVVVAYLQDRPVRSDEFDLSKRLCQIQRSLFKVGAEVAGVQMDKIEKSSDLIDLSYTEKLENEIDWMWAQLVELKNFILPGGSKTGAFLHLARTVCRRAERELVSLGKHSPVRSELYIYLNRLSDFLFAAARWVNWKMNVEEELVK